MSWENRLTVGVLDDDNGDFEGAGPDGTDISTNTDWIKFALSAEIDDEAGSGVTSYNGSTFCAKIHTATGDYPHIYLAGANVDAAFTVGEWYEISLDYKTLNCTDANFRLSNAGFVTDVNISLTSVVWTTTKSVFQLTGNNDITLRLLSHNNTDETGDEVLWVDNVSIKPHRKRRIIGAGII